MVAAMLLTLTLAGQTKKYGLALSESFENGLPDTWTQEFVRGNHAWTVEEGDAYPDGAADGAKRIALRNGTSQTIGYITRLVTPVMNLDTIYEPILTFAYATDKWAGDFDTLKIFYRTSADMEWVEYVDHPLDRYRSGWTRDTLRLNARDRMRNVPDERRYDYFKGLDRSSGTGKVGYFAGCMTLLTPRTLSAMSAIFDAAGEEVWWADREGGVCCGRPLKLAGETDSAHKMMKYNADLFRKHGITTLVTSCPICLKVFREDYDLPGVEVLHHSEYILRLIRAGRLTPEHGTTRFTYHDPCELGRGSGIYDEPRAVIEAVGELLEPASARENALCCGSSVANTAISDGQQVQIARAVAGELEATGAEVIVTACPLCKKAIGRGTKGEVRDLAEIVAGALK